MTDTADFTTIFKITPELHDGPRDSVIARFPNELLAELFVVSTVTPLIVPPPLQESDLPWALLRVSKKWRQVALETPDLWNNVRLDYDQGGRVWGSMGFSEAQYMLERTVAVEKILGRTKDSKVSLEIRAFSFYDTEKWMSRIFNLIARASTNISCLTIYFSFDVLDAFLQLEPIHFPLLESISIDDGHAINAIDVSNISPMERQISVLHNTPRLRNFFLGANIAWKKNTTALDWAQLSNLTLRVTQLPVEEAHTMLRLCPNLVSLRITPGTLMSQNTRPLDQPVYLPSLTTLTVEFWATEELPTFLQPLVIPRLRRLLISYIFLKPDWDSRLISILSQYTQLESLACRECMPVKDIHALLTALPTLRELLLPNDSALPEEVLPGLSEGTLLPRVEIVSCTIRPESLTAHLKMIQSRGTSPGGVTRIFGILNWHGRSVSKEDAHGAMYENAQLIETLSQDNLISLVH